MVGLFPHTCPSLSPNRPQVTPRFVLKKVAVEGCSEKPNQEGGIKKKQEWVVRDGASMSEQARQGVLVQRLTNS